MPRKSKRRAGPEPEVATDEKPAKRIRKSAPENPDAKAIVSGNPKVYGKKKRPPKKKPGAGKSEKVKKFVGAHTSISGGLHNAVAEAASIGANAFALFLRSQRTWACKPLETEKAELFKAACADHGFSPKHILPHGSYLLNLGSPNAETLRKSRETLVDELQRCEALGLCQYNFHPGSTCGEISVEECCKKVAEGINRALDKTSGVTVVIENMSRQGNTIGGRFEEIRSIIDGVRDKSRVGVCIDTCHAFAAGFDIRDKKGFDSMMKEFDDVIGLKFLCGMHLNDSKGELGCHLDRHENIGKGKLGLEVFRCIMNDPRLADIPLILETPMGVSDADEVKLLFSLQKS